MADISDAKYLSFLFCRRFRPMILRNEKGWHHDGNTIVPGIVSYYVRDVFHFFLVTVLDGGDSDDFRQDCRGQE